jgi:hypothetical protein
MAPVDGTRFTLCSGVEGKILSEWRIAEVSREARHLILMEEYCSGPKSC